MRNKRKNYFIKKGFQTKLTVIILLITVIVANLVGGLIYGILTGHEATLILSRLFEVRSGDLLLPVIILSEFLAVLIVAVIGVYVSHTMAGPVYRFERVLDSMSEGDFDCSFQLRTHDEFHEIEDGLNRLIGTINEKMKDAKREAARLVDDLKRQAPPAEIEATATRLSSTLDYFRITDLVPLDPADAGPEAGGGAA